MQNCTPVNIALWDSGSEAVIPNQPGTLVLQADFGGGNQYAILPFDQTLPDYTLDFSPASLTIPAGGSGTLSVSYSASVLQYCSAPGSPTIESGAISAPPPLGSFPTAQSLPLCDSLPVTISVPANVPPGNYELTVSSTLASHYTPYLDYVLSSNPTATIAAAHTFGFPLTVTAAPAPSFQLSASPGDISVEEGQSFPVTVSATGSNGFTGAISVSATNLPTGVAVTPSSFTVDAGASQPITISVASGTAAASDVLTLTGTAGSLTNSTQIDLSVTGP